MLVSGGNRVTVTAMPVKELFNSFFAQVKLAAAPAAIGTKRVAISKECINCIRGMLPKSNLLISPIIVATNKAVREDIIKTKIDLIKTLIFKMLIESEIERMGESRGATIMPPIIKITLFLIRPAATIKVERTRSK